MSFEVGSVTLGVNIAYQQAIENLKKIDTFAGKMTREQGRDYARWWREALKEKDKAERAQADYHLARIRQETQARRQQEKEAEKAAKRLGAAERAETQRTADYWMAKRRLIMATRRAEFAAYAEQARKERASDKTNADLWIASRRRRIAIIRAEYAAYAEQARKERAENKANSDAWLAERRKRIAIIRAESQAYREEARRQRAIEMEIARGHLSEHRMRLARIRAETAAYVENKRREMAADMALAQSHMLEHRRKMAMARAESAAYAENARRQAAARAATLAAMAVATRQSQQQIRAQQVAAAAQARQARASARINSRGGASFGIGGLGLGAIGGAALGMKLVQTANDMQVIQQRLDQVSGSSEEVDLVFNKLATSSQRLRQPLTQMSELYTKLRQSNENVGLSVSETLKVTEAFSAALRLSGATGQTAASALLQFGQAMAKGNLDGDEFRTIAENNSEVLLVLQRRYGKTREEILKMREEGQLTARMMSDALIAEFDNLINRANKLPPTLGQGATAISNALLIVLTNSEDAREAIGKLGTAMVGVADLIQENGDFLLGMAKFAALAWSAHKAFLLIDGIIASGGLASLMLKLSTGAAGGMALGIAVATDMFGTEAKKKEDARRANALLSLSEKDLAANINVRAKSMAEAQAIIDKAVREKRTVPLGAVEIVDRERRAILEYQKALRTIQAKRKMDAKPEPRFSPKPTPTGRGGAGTKEPDIDKEIADLLDLYEAGELNEKGLERLTQLRDESQSTLMRLADTETYTAEQARQHADALARVERISGTLNPMVELQNDDVKEQGRLLEYLNDNYDDLTASMQRLANELSAQEVMRLNRELHQAQKDLLTAVAGLDSNLVAELYQKIAELQGKIRELQQKMAERNAQGMGTGGEPTEGSGKKAWWETAIEGVDRHMRRLQRSILDTFLSAPGELISAYFDDMANAIANGGRNAGEAMNRALAGIASSAGKQMIEAGMAKLTKLALASFGKMMLAMGGATSGLGKFLTAIKAKLANPLVAGPALIALGIGLAAYGAKMGAIGRGEGGSMAGTIGGLSVGGQSDSAQRFVFGNRRNPLEGNRVAVARDSIVVNQTIIGPNDPVAQRQIADLVNNADRRGLVARRRT